MTTVVYKIGGSLLDLPDLGRRVCTLVGQNTGRPLFLVGGGPTADMVREWDRRHELGQERAHWLALKSLKLNEALVAELLNRATLVANRDEAESVWKQGDWPLLCAHDFLACEEQRADPADRLAHHWDATSDAIAAWITLRWPAERLVLLKSTSLNQAGDARRRDADNLVDPLFPQLADRLANVCWVNLRADQPAIETWK